MEIIKSLNLIDNAGLTVLILICSMGFTALTKVATPLENKYLPFVSMIFGIIVGILVALIFHEDIGRAAIAGLLVGGFTSGLYAGVKGSLGGYDTSVKSTISDDLTEVKTPNYNQKNNTRRN
ncbi:hypothetical protein LKI01_23580 [Companilactobacillus paralimentarius]|nr:hypothetical protein LKI01_23580 [Companilactobacillus paralimentarius]